MQLDVNRPILRATILRLERGRPDVAAVLQGQMLNGPLAKSSRNTGGPESDYFRIELDVEQVGEIVSLLGDLEAELADHEAPPMRVTATADLLDHWNRFLQR